MTSGFVPLHGFEVRVFEIGAVTRISQTISNLVSEPFLVLSGFLIRFSRKCDELTVVQNPQFLQFRCLRYHCTFKLLMRQWTNRSLQRSLKLYISESSLKNAAREWPCQIIPEESLVLKDLSNQFGFWLRKELIYTFAWIQYCRSEVLSVAAYKREWQFRGVTCYRMVPCATCVPARR